MALQKPKTVDVHDINRASTLGRLLLDFAQGESTFKKTGGWTLWASDISTTGDSLAVLVLIDLLNSSDPRVVAGRYRSAQPDPIRADEDKREDCQARQEPERLPARGSSGDAASAPVSETGIRTLTRDQGAQEKQGHDYFPFASRPFCEMKSASAWATTWLAWAFQWKPSAASKATWFSAQSREKS